MIGETEKNGPLRDGSPRILYRDSRCLVVNKLPGEAVEGAAPGMIDLPRLLAETSGVPSGPEGLAVPVAVNRLDVPASGCVLFARTRRALPRLNAALRQGGIEKRYWVIAENPSARELPEAGEWVHWLRRNPRTNKSRAWAEEGPGRKQGILRYRIKGRGERYIFLEIELAAGRHHQIRAQLAAQGLFIKGDLKYGARRSERGGGIRLHARSLCFPDPAEPERIIRVIAPPPVRDRLWLDFEVEAASLENFP
ncbi:MAG: RNA pseudouridine synthase [Spirochaetaceae bacterium]|jgi:23S rRNA pseudouridine1911/1915/1917 synthase|nr:RNA pseudouridine synthase [Spirochaetaceae bacterium]